MKITKTLAVAVVVTAILLWMAVLVVLADPDVSGSFTASNSLPDVTALQLYSDADCTASVTNITPQVMYYAKVTASDANTLEDVDEVVFTLFYDIDGTDPVAPTISDTQTCAIFTWDKDGGGSEWTVAAGVGTTWAVTTGDCVKPATMTDSSGDWVFAVTAGKVATESLTTDNWDMYAKATDASGSDTIYERDKEMLWYGEITANTAEAAFGDVAPGTGFADNVNEIGSVSVTYISNGDYDQKVKSAATWAGGTYTATFDAAGTCGSALEFSLNAFDADTFASRVQVDTTGVSIDATCTLTGEAGNIVTTNTLWLKVASVFSIDTYTGNITYIIENR